jgi:flagellin-like protein
MLRRPGTDRGASSLVGIILLVAVAVVLGSVLLTLSLTFLDGAGTPTAEASFSYEQTPVGLRMIPEALGTDVTVQLNGEPVAEFAADSAGQSVLLPTAPGDRITVISADGEQSILVQEEIDERSEVGDLIAYYPFEDGSGATVVDESGNGNDGTAVGDYSRVDSCGSAIDFEGTSGTHINVGDLTLVGPDSIDEMTIAITYQYDGGTDIQNLIEYQSSNFAWFMETDGQHGDPHRMEYNLGYRTSPSNRILTGDIPSGPTQTLVGTFDGEQMSLYRNGEEVDTVPLDRELSLGEVILAADSDPSSVGQNLDGRLCEVRLYYSAFDDGEVEVLSNAMER